MKKFRLRSAAVLAVVALTSVLHGFPVVAGPAEQDAVRVIRHYYSAIDHKNYKAAFNDWWGASRGVLPTGQTYTAFRKGFKQTATVAVNVGTPGEVEGAMGSSYIEIPVAIEALTITGKRQLFAGKYTLRKSNLTAADGVPPEEMTWHLYAASLAAVK